jgi:hypothetical protein
MPHALVVDDVIESVGALPSSARRLDNGDWVMNLKGAGDVLQQECGWFPVVEGPRPPDTVDTTYDWSIELVNDFPSRVWTARPKTQAELDKDGKAENHTTILANLEQDMAAIQLILDDSNSNINANPAQRIKEMGRMLRRLGRLAIDDLDGTN